MYYEEKWVEGWLWYRHAFDGPWVTASDEQMVARMRKALELIVEATHVPDDRKQDLNWHKGAILAARGAARTALGR